jgi:hypothetical protein
VKGFGAAAIRYLQPIFGTLGCFRPTPYVRIFHGFLGWGYHFIASTDPIPNRTASQLAERLPGRAVEDLTEWGTEATAEGQFLSILNNEVRPDLLIAEAPNTPALRDDLPANEYYVLRRQFSAHWTQHLFSQQHVPIQTGR